MYDMKQQQRKKKQIINYLRFNNIILITRAPPEFSFKNSRNFDRNIHRLH